MFIYPSPFHASYLFLPCLRSCFVSSSLSKCSPFVSSLTSFLLNSLSSMPFLYFLPFCPSLFMLSILYLCSCFFFLSFHVPFISILFCYLSFPVFIVIRRSEKIRRIRRKCTDLSGILCRQWLRHIWPVASDWARFAPPCRECWVCSTNLASRPQFAVGRSAQRVFGWCTFWYVHQ